MIITVISSEVSPITGKLLAEVKLEGAPELDTPYGPITPVYAMISFFEESVRWVMVQSAEAGYTFRTCADDTAVLALGAQIRAALA